MFITSGKRFSIQFLLSFFDVFVFCLNFRCLKLLMHISCIMGKLSKKEYRRPLHRWSRLRHDLREPVTYVGGQTIFYLSLTNRLTFCGHVYHFVLAWAHIWFCWNQTFHLYELIKTGLVCCVNILPFCFVSCTWF